LVNTFGGLRCKNFTLDIGGSIVVIVVVVEEFVEEIGLEILLLLRLIEPVLVRDFLSVDFLFGSPIDNRKIDC